MYTERKHIEILMFPDGQPHVKFINTHLDILIWAIRNPTDLLLLAEISEAWKATGAHKRKLIIPYLMGARSDRHMVDGDSFDLKVIAGIINSCGWTEVDLLDVHSDVATALINNSRNILPTKLWQSYQKNSPILIVPDAGAVKKADLIAKTVNVKDIVYCIKKRNLYTGGINLEVISRSKCIDQNCLIVDDLCDGGYTFTSIASQLPRPKSVDLMVTHGIFSKGLPLKGIDDIYTTNSYAKINGTISLDIKELL